MQIQNQTIEWQLADLYPKQQEIAQSPAQHKRVCAGRRAGKSKFCCSHASFKALTDQQPIWWVAPTFRNTKAAWRELQQLAEPLVRKRLARVFKDDFLIEYPLNSKSSLSAGYVQVVSAAEPHNMRSIGLGGYIFDEAAYGQEIVASEILGPALLDYGGWSIHVSTPNGYNWFHDEYQRGLRGEEGYASFHFTSYDNPHIAGTPDKRAAIDALRGRMTEKAFRQEILAEFLADALSVFRNVDACIHHDTLPGPLDGHTYVMGVDWGRKHDYTAISIWDVQDRREVVLDRFSQVGFGIQGGRIQALAELWNVTDIQAEENGIGMANVESLQDMGLPVRAFKMSWQSKKALVEKLALGIEKADVGLVADEVAKGELHAYQESVNLATGVIRYNAPEGCFTENTPILLSNGCPIPVSDVQCGYAVVTHTGEAHMVTQVMKRPHKGVLYTIKVSGLPFPIEATPHHPFWAKRRTCKDLQRRSARKQFPSEWIEAADLQAGDWLAVPKRIGLSPVELTEDQLYAIGFWLAEGHLLKGWNNDVRGISLTNTNLSLLERVAPTLEAWFPLDEVKRGNDRGIWMVEADAKATHTTRLRNPGHWKATHEWDLRSRPSGRFFAEFCDLDESGYSQRGVSKRIPAELYNRSGLLALVSGFIDGDGSQRKTQQHDVNIYTTSPTLAWQLRQILIDGGIWCTLRQVHHPDSNRQPGWVLNIKASFLHKLPNCKVVVPEQRHLRHVMEDERGFYTPIRSISARDYDGDVYNCAVEGDNSYVAGGVAVHNSHDDTVVARMLAFDLIGTEIGDPFVLDW